MKLNASAPKCKRSSPEPCPRAEPSCGPPTPSLPEPDRPGPWLTPRQGRLNLRGRYAARAVVRGNRLEQMFRFMQRVENQLAEVVVCHPAEHLGPLRRVATKRAREASPSAGKRHRDVCRQRRRGRLPIARRRSTPRASAPVWDRRAAGSFHGQLDPDHEHTHDDGTTHSHLHGNEHHAWTFPRRAPPSSE